ncbi:cysteine-rich CWC family protein [Janthinobacterium psychrotolerans]|uniref:cysteine-rich CWC family protein n=1 Tax=Janthinobacterium psychrotolerans TaxID=1747903 RepID=UPI0009F612C1|nr:cysteine-rich CWC family protein [Janthinobacterium psychrotolerans]
MSLCTRCGATFTCGQADPSASGACWCAALPPAVPVPLPGGTATGCWCPDCLRAHIASLPLPAK